MDAELQEASKEILRLRGMLRRAAPVAAGAGAGAAVDREAQTAEPEEAGEVVTQQMLARLATLKNVSRGFSLAQDKVNRCRRSSRKLLARLLFNRLTLCTERMMGAAFACVARVTDNRPLQFLGSLLEAWRKVARTQVVERSREMQQDFFANCALVCEFRKRLCQDVLMKTRHIYNVRGVTDWLHLHDGGSHDLWRIALFNHQKHRFLVGDFPNADDGVAEALPAPWYLAPYRAEALKAKLSTGGDGRVPDSLGARFPAIIAGLPSYLLEVLERLRQDEDDEQLEKLLLDVLTFFFSGQR